MTVIHNFWNLSFCSLVDIFVDTDLSEMDGILGEVLDDIKTC